MPMKTIAITAQKGGAGKTTIALHLATAATLAGYHAAIIDLDPQASAALWADDRGDAPPEVIPGQPARLAKLLAEGERLGFDLVFIDTGPAADIAARKAAESADLVLVPCRPAALDLKAVATTLDLIQATRKPGFVVMNAAPVRSRAVDDASNVIRQLGANVAPVTLCQRAAYAHSLIEGRTAQEFEPEGKAAAEIAELWEWTRGRLDLPKPAVKAA